MADSETGSDGAWDRQAATIPASYAAVNAGACRGRDWRDAAVGYNES